MAAGDVIYVGTENVKEDQPPTSKFIKYGEICYKFIGKVDLEDQDVIRSGCWQEFGDDCIACADKTGSAVCYESCPLPTLYPDFSSGS